MNVMGPLVSVLIAAYNAENYLGETLESVLAQTYRPLEVIVVDDGSADGTATIAGRYEAEQPGLVRVMSQENRGACAARNRALREATGDYIQFLDADDLMHPEKIERQVGRLANEPHGTLATGPWVRFRGDVSTADHSRVAPDFRDYEPATDWILQAWQGRGTIPCHAWLVPRWLVDRAGMWNERLLVNQDGEFFTRVLVEARKMAFVDGAWSYYRGVANSVSGRKSDAALRSLFDGCLLCEQTLLSRLDTPAARRACAGLWQGFLFSTYPRLPQLTRQAEERVRALGGMFRKPRVIRSLHPVRDLLGWKAALRLQDLYLRVRYPSR